MKSLLIDILFKVSIGTCLYIHDPAVSAAYGLFILFQLYEHVEAARDKDRMAAELRAMGYEESSPGVWAPKTDKAVEAPKLVLRKFMEDDEDDDGQRH